MIYLYTRSSLHLLFQVNDAAGQGKGGLSSFVAKKGCRPKGLSCLHLIVVISSFSVTRSHSEFFIDFIHICFHCTISWSRSSLKLQKLSRDSIFDPSKKKIDCNIKNQTDQFV